MRLFLKRLALPLLLRAKNNMTRHESCSHFGPENRTGDSLLPQFHLSQPAVSVGFVLNLSNTCIISLQTTHKHPKITFCHTNQKFSFIYFLYSYNIYLFTDINLYLFLEFFFFNYLDNFFFYYYFCFSICIALCKEHTKIYTVIVRQFCPTW